MTEARNAMWWLIGRRRKRSAEFASTFTADITLQASYYRCQYLPSSGQIKPVPLHSVHSPKMC